MPPCMMYDVIFGLLVFFPGHAKQKKFSSKVVFSCKTGRQFVESQCSDIKAMSENSITSDSTDRQLNTPCTSHFLISVLTSSNNDLLPWCQLENFVLFGVYYGQTCILLTQILCLIVAIFSSQPIIAFGFVRSNKSQSTTVFLYMYLSLTVKFLKTKLFLDFLLIRNFKGNK